MSEVKVNKKKALVAASVAGLLALSGMVLSTSPAQAAGDKCYGVNKCHGTGACGGKGHACAGKNACGGQGWLEIDAETCLKINGGSLTPAEE